ncbi:MAG: type II toxin-antitoxin system HicB family antitoxin [Candidatus Sumerlaeaceae bacterium]
MAFDKYVKIVEWSDQDHCYIGSCPELFYGGCHGEDPKEVFAQLCDIVAETMAVYQQEGRQLPVPMTGKDFVNAMQRVA